jgi:hypothetical protein
MYSFASSIEIAAPVERVWRALCNPAEVVQWDEAVLGALDAPADYPQPHQHVRWRYAQGPFRLLHDRPKEVVPNRTLRSLLSLGPFLFDETYALTSANGGTWLRASMIVRAPLPPFGLIIERLYLAAQTKRTVEMSLQAIKRHCEAPA